jgi:hypothetical protein
MRDRSTELKIPDAISTKQKGAEMIIDMNAMASNCIKDEFHLTAEQAMAEAERMWSSAMVTEVFFSSHLDEREIKGTNPSRVSRN